MSKLDSILKEAEEHAQALVSCINEIRELYSGVYLFALLGQHQAEYSECPTLLQIRSRQRLHTPCSAPFVSAVYE